MIHTLIFLKKNGLRNMLITADFALLKFYEDSNIASDIQHHVFSNYEKYKNLIALPTCETFVDGGG